MTPQTDPHRAKITAAQRRFEASIANLDRATTRCRRSLAELNKTKAAYLDARLLAIATEAINVKDVNPPPNQF